MHNNYHVVLFDKGIYVNSNLYRDALVNGSEKDFKKLLSQGKLKGTNILDQVLFLITKPFLDECKSFNPAFHDCDRVLKFLNVLPKSEIDSISKGNSELFLDANIIRIHEETLTSFNYKYFTFFRVRDMVKNKIYNILDRTASIKICGSVYIALNAINVATRSPIVITSY